MKRQSLQRIFSTAAVMVAVATGAGLIAVAKNDGVGDAAQSQNQEGASVSKPPSAAASSPFASRMFW